MQCEVRRCDQLGIVEVEISYGEDTDRYRCCDDCAGELAAFHRKQGASVALQRKV